MLLLLLGFYYAYLHILVYSYTHSKFQYNGFHIHLILCMSFIMHIIIYYCTVRCQKQFTALCNRYIQWEILATEEAL